MGDSVQVAPFEKGGRKLQRGSWSAERDHYEDFCRRNAAWLDNYSLFAALEEAHGGEAMWNRWERDIATRQPAAVDEWQAKLADEIQARKYWQYEFSKQWAALKQYCHLRGIRTMGDIPIFVAHDSADVWAQPEAFYLDSAGDPAVQAGVPPDYFSATGQLWGNPLYRWDAMAASGYSWWIERFQATLGLVDIIRLDHFRGFEAYWEVPGADKTAMRGHWVKAPGHELFEAVQKVLGELPIVAETLGVITPVLTAAK